MSTELEKLRAENASLAQQLAIARLTPELAKAGVPTGAIDDVLRRLQADYRVIDGRLTPLDASAPSDVGEYLANLRTQAPHLFSSPAAPSAKSAVPSSANNPFRKDQINITQQAKLIRKNPDLARRLQAEAAAAGELPDALRAPARKKFRPQR